MMLRAMNIFVQNGVLVQFVGSWAVLAGKLVEQSKLIELTMD